MPTSFSLFQAVLPILALGLGLGFIWALARARRAETNLRANRIKLESVESGMLADRKALEESQARLRALIEAIPDAVFFKDGEGRWQEVNSAGLRLFGLERLPWQGKTEAELAAQQPELTLAYEACRVSDEAAWLNAGMLRGAERVGAWPDERIFDVIKVPLFDSDGGRRGLVIVGRDVTERQRADERLRKLSRAVEQSDSTVVITNVNGDIEFVNPAFERATGYLAEMAIGQNPRILKSGRHPPEFYQKMWGALAKGDVWRGELVNKRRNGTLYWERAVISPVRNDSGEISNYVAVKEDITAQKRTEAELVRAREAADAANRAKGIFLANMSHELRTPLNGILGYAQILLADGALTDRQAQGISVIQQSGRHLLTLINDVLDFSRIESGRLELVPALLPLTKFLSGVADMVRLQAQEKGLAFFFDAAPDLPRSVMADERRIRQVLLNLLGNAVKFTVAGEVALRVSARPEAGTENQGRPRLWLRFEVIDSGPGIPEGSEPRIFVPFEQIGEEARLGRGAGLGLAISRELVRGMGGEIGVESRPGKGSRFFFELPVESSPEDCEECADPSQPPIGYRGQRRKILVVDDIESNRQVVTHMLHPLGFEVLTADDGPGCIRRVRETSPDLILQDLHMAGMSGYDTLIALRREGLVQDIPVVAMTASVGEEERARVWAAEFDDFLPKPLERGALLDLLRRHLGLDWVRDLQTSTASAGPRPPRESLQELAGLARMGQVRKIQEWASALEAEDRGYSSFIAQLRLLLSRYDMRGIRALTEEAPFTEEGGDQIGAG